MAIFGVVENIFGVARWVGGVFLYLIYFSIIIIVINSFFFLGREEEVPPISNEDILCEHKKVGLNLKKMKRVPVSVWEILEKRFVCLFVCLFVLSMIILFSPPSFVIPPFFTPHS